MKVWVIFVLGIFLISFVSSLEIKTDYPSKISFENEFNFAVKLIDFPEGVYDIKIDILGNGSRIARILSGNEWKSTYFYVNSAMSSGEQKEFLLKVVEEYEGKAEIKIRVRENGGSHFEVFSGYFVEVGVNDSGKRVEVGKSSNQDTLNEKEKNETIKENVSKDASELKEENVVEKKKEKTEVKVTKKITGENVVENKPVEEIKLGSTEAKDIKSEENTQKDNESVYALGGLAIFGVLITTLFLVKKRKIYKNEFQ